MRSNAATLRARVLSRQEPDSTKSKNMRGTRRRANIRRSSIEHRDATPQFPLWCPAGPPNIATSPAIGQSIEPLRSARGGCEVNGTEAPSVRSCSLCRVAALLQGDGSGSGPPWQFAERGDRCWLVTLEGRAIGAPLDGGVLPFPAVDAGTRPPSEYHPDL